MNWRRFAFLSVFLNMILGLLLAAGGIWMTFQSQGAVQRASDRDAFAASMIWGSFGVMLAVVGAVLILCAGALVSWNRRRGRPGFFKKLFILATAILPFTVLIFGFVRWF